MSIHKSQGQTLERVKVDLAKIFEKGTWLPDTIFLVLILAKGQAYVALSRATCMDGLQVLHFEPSKVEYSVN